VAAVLRLWPPAPTGNRPVKVHSHALRVIHKWIGLLIGLQVVLWALSGAGMALIDRNEVAGGPLRTPPTARPAATDGWPRLQASLPATPVTGVALRALAGRHVFEVAGAGSTMLFDAASGERVRIDARLARDIALAAYPGRGAVKAVAPLDRIGFAVRGHALPIWRVDFDDARRSSFYISGSTGALLERRNDSWRMWDVLWMLHSMDYVNRTSFNHPLIIIVAFAALWLAVTGLWLLFRTGWRSDFKNSASLHR